MISQTRFFLFGAAFLLGCLAGNAFFHAAAYQFPATGWQGSEGYREIAQNLLDHGLYSQNGASPTANRPPLYPLFLSVWLALFDSAGPSAAYAAQALLWIANGLLIAALLRTRFKRPDAALLALLLYGLHVHFGVEALTQRDTILFALLLTLYISGILYIHSAWGAPLAGALAGLLYLTRPTGILFLPAFLLAYLPSSTGTSWPARLRRAGLVAGIAFGVSLPWHWHTIAVMNAPGLLPASTSGENLYKGHFDGFLRVFPYVDLDLLNPHLNERTAGMCEIQRNQTLKQLGWEHLRDDPVGALLRALVKTAALYSPLRTPLGNGEISMQANGARLDNFQLYAPALWLVPLNLLILAGGVAFFFRFRRLGPTERIFALHAFWILLGLTAIHALTFGESRHRLPFDGLLIIASSLTISRWIPFFRALRTDDA
mgnify:CR=1 FL=1